MNWNEKAWELVQTIVIIPLVAYITIVLRERIRSKTAWVSIRITSELKGKGIKFGLLHIRDGREELPEKGPLLNRVIDFKADPVDESVLRARVRYKSALGFQFKCFADSSKVSFQERKKLLEDAGFLEVSRAGSRKAERRAWFILSRFPRVETAEGIVNNFYYPE